MKEIREKVYKLSKEIWVKLFNIKKENVLRFLAENWLPEYLKNEKRVQVISEFCLKTKEEYEYFIEDENLRKAIWISTYVPLPKHKRDFLIKYKLKNIPKEYLWKYKAIEIYEFLSWEKYEWLATKTINMLKRKWLDPNNLPKWLYEERWRIQVLFFNKSYEEYQLFLKSEIYFKLYWFEFNWIPREKKYKFLEEHNSTPLFLKWRSILEILNFHNKTKEEFEKYLLEKHLREKYWCNFVKIKQKNREELLKKKEVNVEKKKLLNYSKFLKFFEWFEVWEKDFESHSLFKENYRREYSPYKKEIKMELIKFWYEKFLKETERYENIKKWKIFFFLFEQRNSFKFETNNWKIICWDCCNEIVFNKNVFDRLRYLNWKTFNKNYFCEKCFSLAKTSLEEELIYDFIFEFYKWPILRNFKYEKIFEGRKKFSREFDFYFQELNLAVEYNGEYRHKEEKINEKYEYCKQKWINFMIIWDCKEEEWKEILRNKILWKENFTEEIITLENMYYNLTPKGYVKIWEIPQTLEKAKRYFIYNLWKTIYKKEGQ